MTETSGRGRESFRPNDDGDDDDGDDDGDDDDDDDDGDADEAV